MAQSVMRMMMVMSQMQATPGNLLSRGCMEGMIG